MKAIKPEDRKRLIVAMSLLGAIVVAIVALAVTGHLGPLWSKMWEVFKDREGLRTYIESWGSRAPAVFIFLQAFQVVFAPIPGELTGAVGGFIFGAGPSILYSSIGLTIGSIIAFVAARIIGLPLVKLVVSEKSLEKFGFLTRRKGIMISLAFFIIPGFPKDILSYILGLSPMRWLTFVVVCTLGRIPGTILLSFSGSAVYDENWTLLIALSVICLIALGLFVLLRDRIETWLGSKSHDAV
jgi:uncharacterized membrane protein YdjX (TVP38/TMEM64 family)